MMHTFRHAAKPLTVTIDTSANIANCSVIDFRDWQTGTYYIASGSPTSVNFYVCDTSSGTYVPLYDLTNTIIATTIAASRGYPLPTQLVGAHFLKIVGNAAGTLKLCMRS